ncbi:hypothetical protein B4U79_02000 [Dinothrombium tinctorium]|uniref:Uncharacterized protein n=1 Tax=Dinothrombium tinctorium TaxID=1965070 RepID=A0A443QIN0_9ACAR|nr:hypothetical protein B4U79_02000 [Dinothrombium tinctorium]
MKILEAHKVVVMGDGGVGKTSLVTQFMEGYFTSQYKPTVEDYYRHTLQLPDGIFQTVDILDTAGTHYFPAMRELNIRNGRGFVIVFSVDNLQSFNEAISLWELITRIRGKQVPIVLVGNKSDLTETRTVTEELVSKSRAELMNNCPYIETSAKYNLNVANLFYELLQQAREQSGTPIKKNKKFSERLNSFGSLPNISLIKRKSSDLSKKLDKTTVHTQLSLDETKLSRNEQKCVIS